MNIWDKCSTIDPVTTDNRIVFNSLDLEAEIDISQRNLPHWFQVGAATFVTFRTADSIPKSVLLRWQRELVEWLKLRNLPCDLADSIFSPSETDRARLLDLLGIRHYREFKRLSDRIFHQSLDECHGVCLLRAPSVAKIVAEAVLHYVDEKYNLDNFIVMPNHVHAIVQFRVGANLDTVSQSWMRYSARRINQLLKREGHVWQAEPFDHIIRSPEQFHYLHNYIADNPQKANLPSSDYHYWSRPL